MESFAAIIDALGIAVTAEAIGLPESHVRTLKTRDSIPPTYFARMVRSEAGKQHGVSFELLYRLHEKAPGRRTSRTANAPGPPDAREIA